MKLKNKYILIFAAIFFINIVSAPTPTTSSWIFDTTAKFDTGTYNGLNTSFNKLSLTDNAVLEESIFWVANSGDGTISKINTVTNNETARYYTANYSVGKPEPSRTAVDADGNVWVGNKKGEKTVIKIAGNIKNCNDTNGVCSHQTYVTP